MSKSYDHVYHFKGSGTECGTMVCCVCHKPVISETQDWKEAKKDKNGDWGYICHHRECYSNQDGWVNSEKEMARKKAQFEKAKIAVLKCIDEIGGEGMFDDVIDDLGYYNYSQYQEGY